MRSGDDLYRICVPCGGGGCGGCGNVGVRKVRGENVYVDQTGTIYRDVREDQSNAMLVRTDRR